MSKITHYLKSWGREIVIRLDGGGNVRIYEREETRNTTIDFSQCLKSNDPRVLAARKKHQMATKVTIKVSKEKVEEIISFFAPDHKR